MSTTLFTSNFKHSNGRGHKVTAPSLNNAIKRTCDTLRQGATKQVTDYEKRFSSIKNIYDDLLANLIRTGFNPKDAYETALEFFGGTTVRFAGVDGTMYSKPLFDMVIFFGGAYAATGTIRFSETADPEVAYDERTLQRSMGVSSVVPIYINEILDVDTSYAAQEQPGEVNPAKPMTDEEIANNSLIANVIMTFSEYFLAYKLAADPAQARNAQAFFTRPEKRVSGTQKPRSSAANPTAPASQSTRTAS
jgi:hypothetical protein